jgi:hypothetical protein
MSCFSERFLSWLGRPVELGVLVDQIEMNKWHKKVVRISKN